MKPCVIMSLDDYEDIRLNVQHAINILENKRVSVKDRLSVLASLYNVRNKLDEDDVEMTVNMQMEKFAKAIDRRIDDAILG